MDCVFPSSLERPPLVVVLYRLRVCRVGGEGVVGACFAGGVPMFRRIRCCAGWHLVCCAELGEVSLSLVQNRLLSRVVDLNGGFNTECLYSQFSTSACETDMTRVYVGHETRKAVPSVRCFSNQANTVDNFPKKSGESYCTLHFHLFFFFFFLTSNSTVAYVS